VTAAVPTDTPRSSVCIRSRPVVPGLAVGLVTAALAPGAKLEADLRVRLSDHPVDAPAAIHDEWGSGQLLSRSMCDIRRFRRWISFGMTTICVKAWCASTDERATT
jgi:hypothetical protein